mmetsp:Transcript_37583/g.88920  ORF Transcript_37583/g.88920 Transcript_37583/m.88920 type:complete len:538 (-) Transcript_37583:560-2173(-)
MRALECLVREPHAPLVRDVLPEGVDAVDVLAVVQRLVLEAVAIVLVREAPCALVELFERLRVPPVSLVAVSIEEVPRVVEPMRHLMPTDCPERAVVPGIMVRLRVERLLDDPRRDEQAVDDGRVEGVDHNRVALAPPVALRVLEDPHLCALDGVAPNGVNVLGVRPRHHPLIPRRALWPLVRVRHLIEHLVELLLAREARLLVHPSCLLQRLAELLLDLVEHPKRDLLLLLRERLCYEHVARCPPEEVRRVVEALLLPHLGWPFAVPCIVPVVQRVDKVLVEIRRVAMHQAEAHVRLHALPALVLIVALAREDVLEHHEVVSLLHDEAGAGERLPLLVHLLLLRPHPHLGEVHGGEPPVPINRRRVKVHVVAIHPLVVPRVARALGVVEAHSKLLLDGEHVLGVARGRVLVVPRELDHVDNKRAERLNVRILLPRLSALHQRVAVEVEIRGSEKERVAVLVPRVDVHVPCEEHAHVRKLDRDGGIDKRRVVLNRLGEVHPGREHVPRFHRAHLRETRPVELRRAVLLCLEELLHFFC